MKKKLILLSALFSALMVLNTTKGSEDLPETPLTTTQEVATGHWYDSLTNIYETAKQKAQEVLENIKQTFSGSTLSSSASDKINDFKQKIKNVAQEAKSKISKAAQSVKENVSNLAKKATSTSQVTQETAPSSPVISEQLEQTEVPSVEPGEDILEQSTLDLEAGTLPEEVLVPEPAIQESEALFQEEVTPEGSSTEAELNKEIADLDTSTEALKEELQNLSSPQ